MEAVIHHSSHYCPSRLPLMCSFHRVISSPSFNSSVFVSFFSLSVLPLLLSHTLIHCLYSTFSPASGSACLFSCRLLPFDLSVFRKWLSALSHQSPVQERGQFAIKPMGKKLDSEPVFLFILINSCFELSCLSSFETCMLN